MELGVSEAVFFPLNVAHEQLFVGAEVAVEREHVGRVLHRPLPRDEIVVVEFGTLYTTTSESATE